MTQIRGRKADDNDNNPVEVRRYQIQGSSEDDALGRFPTSPIWYRHETGVGYLFWQYYPNGIIISTPNTCACVLYGPIYRYWDQTGQFDGPLGAPTTDVLRLPGPPSSPGSPPPPPRGSYAVFEHGVLYLDPNINASVVQLTAVSPGMVANATSITPTGSGIAQAAQATLQAFANNALATDQDLSDNVESISTRTSFHSTGPGGCSGASFNAVGRSLLRSHILDVHFDFGLKGCAGSFGDAWADVRIEVRLFIDPPRVNARLVHYWIDGVGSPFSAGDRDIRDGLSRSLNGQFGRDLLNRTIPKGMTVLAGIVEPNGDANLYIAPICAANALLSQTRSATMALERLRTLRDQHLTTRDEGRAFIELVEVFGPALVTALGDESDAQRLHEALAHLLIETFTKGADLPAIAARIETVTADLLQLLAHPAARRSRDWPRRLTKMAVRHIRDHLGADKEASFDETLSHVERLIRDETEHYEACGADDRLAD